MFNKSPILLITFRRLNATKQVMQQIINYKPKELFIFSDQGRNSQEQQLVDEVRDYLNAIQIPGCVIHYNFSSKNLGVKQGPVTAINWFFDHIDQGIILEDDCLPGISFFDFAGTMLDKYKNNEKIMNIGGLSMITNKINIDDLYYFSRIPQIRGWATRKRARKHYDISIPTYPQFKKNGKIKQLTKNKLYQKFLTLMFFNAYNQKKFDNARDFQRTFTLLDQGGYSITPRKNLIKNIGFGELGSNSLREKDGEMVPNIDDFSKQEIEQIEDYRANPNQSYDDAFLKEVFNITIFDIIVLYVGIFARKINLYEPMKKIYDIFLK